MIAIQQYLTLAAPIAVIVGVIIALMQLRNQTRLRQVEVVMRLFSSFGQESFLRHFRRVTTWDFNSYEKFKDANKEEDFISLFVVSVFFENMGLLYKRRLASLDLLDDLLSGPVIRAWEAVRPIWIGFRTDYQQPQWAEWFELLYDAMQTRLARLKQKGA